MKLTSFFKNSFDFFFKLLKRFVFLGFKKPVMYFPIMTEYAVQCLQAQIPPFSFPFNPIQELNALDVMLKKTDPMLLTKIG